MISSNETIPSRVYYAGSYGTTFYISTNATDNNSNIVSVNFTLTAPNGTEVINNTNASVHDGDIWNSSSYAIDAYGQWNYSINAWDNNSNSDNSTGEISAQSRAEASFFSLLIVHYMLRPIS